MKLGKLLGAGKSFFGWQGAVTYRENKRVYLPKFNPDRNPFTLKKAESEVSEPEAAAPVLPVLPALAQPQKAAAPAESAPVRPPNWTEKLNPFRGVKPVKPVPQAAMPNVQPEFTLGAVKVVHNDLSDADVEVVPMKSRSATPAPALDPSSTMDILGEPILKSI